MRRVYFLPQWYALADAALEDALYDSRSMRAFVGGEVVPDATTLLKFRHLLERHGLTRQIFDSVNALLAGRGAFLREGTIVDATVIAAAPSTKNAAKARDAEMRQTKKGHAWHFGLKAHVGVDLGGRPGAHRRRHGRQRGRRHPSPPSPARRGKGGLG